MTTLVKTSLLILIHSSVLFAYIGEYRFLIDDDSWANYKILAHRINLNEPLFGIDFMMVETHDYDDVWVFSEIQKSTTVPAPFEFYIAFDFLRDQGNSMWPIFGEGLYEYNIYRNEILVFRFKFDSRHLNSQNMATPDINFYWYSEELKLTAQKGGNVGAPIHQIFYDQLHYSWIIWGETRDISWYENEVKISNSSNGLINSELSTKLNEATMGFPYDNHQSGYEFEAEEYENFWRGALYGLEITEEIFIRNDTIFKFRNWQNDNFKFYPKSTALKIFSNTDKITSIYNHALPLNITNNLEGYNLNNNYKIKWNAFGEEQTINPNDAPFYAFNYVSSGDEYEITAFTSFQHGGTSWYFQNWGDGSTALAKEDQGITPLNNTYTFHYKGSQRSDNADAFDNSSQRKFVNTYGKLCTVYESMGKVWYEKSTNNGADWILMNDGKALS